MQHVTSTYMKMKSLQWKNATEGGEVCSSTINFDMFLEQQKSGDSKNHFLKEKTQIVKLKKTRKETWNLKYEQ